MVVASSLQIKKKKAAIYDTVKDVIQQVSPAHRFVTAFVANFTDPCLQIADYATWAVQRLYEHGDGRSFDRVKHLVASCFEPFALSETRYY